jgi:hypothetical protein
MMRRVAACFSALAIVAMPAKAATIFKETGGRVVIEAEHFDTRVNHPTEAGRWLIIPDEIAPPAGTPTFTNARGGQYVSSQPDSAGAGINHNTGAPPIDNPPHIEYKVNITTPGDYQLWLRWGGYDGSSDSMYGSIVELHGSAPAWYRYSRNIGGDFNAQGGWQGIGGADSVSGGPDATDGPAIFSIATAGTYTIRITQREDGSAVDALILQLDTMADPTDPAPAESDLSEGIVAGTPANVAAVPPATATFNSVVKTGAGGTVTYQWQSKAPGATVFTDIAGATSANYTTAATTLAMNGTQYRFKATSGATTVTSGAATLTTDATAPTIAYAFATGTDSVRIGFSEALNSASATTGGNFTLSGGATVTSATLGTDGKTVTLKTSSLTPATSYTLTVNGVKDLAGNTLNNGTQTFVGSTVLRLAKTIENRFWDNFTANNVSALKALATYPGRPDRIQYETMFEYPPEGGGEGGSNYGNRLSGWVTAPETGDYVFFTNSDDPSELWLSTDSDPTNKKLIAIEPTWNNARAWTSLAQRDPDHPQNRSDQYQATQWPTKNVDGGATITLQQGQAYYIEVLHTEGGGGDNVGVNWRLPSAAGADPADGEPPISGELVDQIYQLNGAVVVGTQPQNVNAQANSTATFNVAATTVDNSGVIYIWQKAAPGSQTFENAGVLGTSLTTPLLTTADSGTQYRVLILSPSGAAISQVGTLNVTTDTQAPQVAYFNGMRRYAQVVFNEPIDPVTGAALSSYSIDAGSITAATVSTAPDGRGVVTLDLSGLSNLQSYTVTIKDVKDTVGNTMTQTTRTFTAYDIVSDFNGGVPPPVSTMTGSAKVLPAGGSDGSGVLELTPNLGSLQGTLGIDDVLAGETVDEATKMTARFKLFIGGVNANGSGNPADGFSFNVASDIDATTVNTGEEGTGSGLTIAFDTYDNGGLEAPAIDVKVGGQVIATTVGSAVPVPAKATLNNNQWVDVFIQFVGDATTGIGKVTVIHNNVTYYDQLEVPLGSIPTPRIAIGARTGGEFARHWVDNLNVLYNIDVAVPVPPTITITAPAAGTQITAGGPATITVDVTAPGGLNKVEYFANGQLLGQTTTAPHSLTIPAVPPGYYSVTARVTDNNGVAVTSAPIDVTAHQPAAANADKVLYLHAAAGPNPADIAAINRLFSRGMDVFNMGAINSATTDADDKKLVVISSSVPSGDVASKFTGVAAGVVNWENALEDDLLWTGAPDTERQVTGATQTQVDITAAGAAHPLGAGLPVGPVTITTSAADFSWGKPGPEAVRIATVAADPTRVVIYGYEKGALLIDGTTPAAGRRVNAGLTDNTFVQLNADGLKLFDAAIDWARASGTNPTTPQITAATLSGSNINITWTNGGTLEWTSALLPNNGTVWTSTNDSDGSYSEPVTTAQMKIFRVRK